MATVYQLPTQIPGTVDVFPNFKFAVFGDNLATVTTAGYLNQVSLESAPVAATDVINALYSYNPNTKVGIYEQFSVAIANGVITLNVLSQAGEVVLPTTANHVATYTNATGQLSQDPTTALTGDNFQAFGSIYSGQPGSLGSFLSYPPTANLGLFIFRASNNAGAFNTVVTNASQAQASVISIPDPGAATANFLLNSGVNTMAAGSSIVLAKVNGTEATNAVTASGNAGVITTSSLTTAAGSSYAITWTNTKISTTSVIELTVMGGTNTTVNTRMIATAGSGTSTLTIYNTDPSASLNGTIFIGYAVL